MVKPGSFPMSPKYTGSRSKLNGVL
ncbi:hypothetical protein KIPB_014839, partial [Kipferlia bialata]|eukprot:g14839.t1